MVLSILPTFLLGLPGSSTAVLGLIEGLAEALSYALRAVSGIFSDTKPSIVGQKKQIPIAKLLRGAHHRDDGTMLMAEFFYDPKNEMLNKEFKGNMSMAYTFGTHGVEVEVDKETGKVEILRYVSAHDVGKALNPMLLEGQIYGGAMMGIGYALTEQLVLRDGEVQNPTLRDYNMLTANDVVPMKSFVVETNDEHGPFGAKGIGEPGCVPSAPAIANAIYDAVGVRITDLPITPEKVLAALKEKGGKQ